MKVLSGIFLIILFFTSAGFSQNSGNEFTKEDLQKNDSQLNKLYQEKRYNDALPLAKKSVLMAQQIYGENHLETANSLKTLGYIHFLKDDKKSAEKNLENAFEIYEKLPDLNRANGESVAKMLETLALIKYEERMKSGEKYYRTALEWREKYTGKDSPETLLALAALANISYWDRDYKKSSQLFRRVIEIGVKNPEFERADIDVAFYRAQCGYKKTGNSADLEELNKIYKPQTGMRVFSSGKTSDAQNQKLSRTNVIEGGMVNGKAVSLPAPLYPWEAKARGARGKAVVQILLSENGDVLSACTISQIDSLLAESAENAAYQAKFRPTQLENKAVRVSGVITYIFN